MTVCRQLSAAAALCALLFGAGCSDRGDAQRTAETDDPNYVQGAQLKRQGRNAEALTAFLKVIERRGERASAESHLDAGVIYLNHIKDPIAACYHFRKYLELQPNSKEAPRVRGMIDAAKREFARTIPARPLDDQSSRLSTDEELKRLQRENDELRAMVATLRGGDATPVHRPARMIALPDELRTRSAGAPVNVADESPLTRAPAQRPAPTPLLVQPPMQAAALATRSAPPTSAAAARTHTVAPKDTLYSISVKYYGNGRQVDAIFDANRSVMRSTTDLKIGMTLQIPALDGRSRR